MRLTSSLLQLKGKRPSRLFQREETVPFEEILPMMLKNRVSGKGVKSSNVCCLQEMFVLFSCLKTNDFKESPCSKEVSNFQKCYVENIAARGEKKEMERKGQLTPGATKMGHLQINKLLRMFPSHPPTKSKA